MTGAWSAGVGGGLVHGRLWRVVRRGRVVRGGGSGGPCPAAAAACHGPWVAAEAAMASLAPPVAQINSVACEDAPARKGSSAAAPAAAAAACSAGRRRGPRQADGGRRAGAARPMAIHSTAPSTRSQAPPSPCRGTAEAGGGEVMAGAATVVDRGESLRPRRRSRRPRRRRGRSSSAPPPGERGVPRERRG